MFGELEQLTDEEVYKHLTLLKLLLRTRAKSRTSTRNLYKTFCDEVKQGESPPETITNINIGPNSTLDPDSSFRSTSTAADAFDHAGGSRKRLAPSPELLQVEAQIHSEIPGLSAKNKVISPSKADNSAKLTSKRRKANSALNTDRIEAVKSQPIIQRPLRGL